MRLVLGGDARQAGDGVAEAAFSYAAGHPGTQTARRYGRSVSWRRSYDQAITDQDVCTGPADDERGHAGNRSRLTATIARHDAGREAGR